MGTPRYGIYTYAIDDILQITSLHVVYLMIYVISCCKCRVATKGQRPLLVAKLLAAGSRVGSVEDYPWSQCPLYLAVMSSFYFFLKSFFIHF